MLLGIKKETHLDVFVAIVTKRFDIKDDGDDDHGYKSNQMAPNVASFSMNSKNGFKTC